LYLILAYEAEQGRRAKLQNEQRQECIKKRWEPLVQHFVGPDVKSEMTWS